MQNGLNVEVDLYNALKEAGVDNPKILSTAVWIGTNLLAPNVVQHSDFVSTKNFPPDYIDLYLKHNRTV